MKCFVLIATHFDGQLYESVAVNLTENEREAAQANYMLLNTRIIDATRMFQVIVIISALVKQLIGVLDHSKGCQQRKGSRGHDLYAIERSGLARD